METERLQHSKAADLRDLPKKVTWPLNNIRCEVWRGTRLVDKEMQAGGHQAVRHATCIYAARQTHDIRSASSQLRVVHENIDTAAPLCVDDAATRLVDIHFIQFGFFLCVFYQAKASASSCQNSPLSRHLIEKSVPVLSTDI
ncbi:hypothetical protein C0Q70_00588 [Pomacea canaliculata]|uniref:Uncharacterized protein n=1 Tax=Pomacea canaliculata TaxID=400727 RepID=A0A2T7PX30_POMCA|nr:hypothetical protein C0Q70_00588 [Pomacea canaliculata]